LTAAAPGPHQSLLPKPGLLIADEATSALDVTVPMQVPAILGDLVRQRGMGLNLISHGPDPVASFRDRVPGMYADPVAAEVAARTLAAATHPCTQSRLRCLPRIADDRADLPMLTGDAAWID
jgi:peptide/nickel transport system ATP-binding protein